MATTGDGSTEPATRVVLSYPAALSSWGRSTLEGSPFRSYLRKAHDRAVAGETWEEFVGAGCCGDTEDVTLRVESVEGGRRLTAETTVEFAVRDPDT